MRLAAGVDWSAPSYDEVLRRHRWEIPERLNLATACCDARVGRRAQALVCVDDRGGVASYTFERLKELSDRFASALAALGVEREDRVAVFLPQRAENPVAHLAAFKLGAISVPLSPLFREEALEHRLRSSGAKVLVTDADHVAFVEGLRDTLPDLRAIVCADGGAPGCEGFEALVEKSPPPARVADTAADDPAMLIYTSGTEGPAKGALHAHRFIPGRLAPFELLHRLEAAPEVPGPFWTPADWAWVAGLVDSVLTPWAYGRPILGYRRRGFDPEAAFGLIARMKVRSMFLPPTALNMLRRVENPRERYDLKVFSVHTAGEPLGPETFAWARSVFGEVRELYGMTEMGAIVGNSPFFPAKPGSMGKPYPGRVVALIDDRGEPVREGEVGEVAVRKGDPGMFLGYWNDPAATAARFRGDWLATGDLARRDADGYYFYEGRADDQFKSSGYRIGPTEIEHTLEGHSAVERAAVVGEPDAERGMVVKAWIVLRPGVAASDSLADEIRAHVKTRLAAYEYPRKIVFARELPMTVTGKVRRAELRKPGAEARWGGAMRRN